MDIRKLYRKIATEDKAGLYITVIFHLTVIIVLLVSQLTNIAIRDNAFLMDFSKQEEAERTAEEEAFKEEISRRLDRLLGDIPVTETETEVKNLAVDASEALRDDRETNTDDLYRDAARLAEKLSGTDHRDRFAGLPRSVRIRSWRHPP